MTVKPPPAESIQELSGQPPSAAALRELMALRGAVAQALDRKWRLGQYAVVWEGGAVRTLAPDDLPVLAQASERWHRAGGGQEEAAPLTVQEEAQPDAWPAPTSAPKPPRNLP